MTIAWRVSESTFGRSGPVMNGCGRYIGAAAAHFAVSRELMRWRFNQTGAARELRARDAKGGAT